ncbi:hypothetical protein SDC9_178475 [bioreactor metagenome]|uniref:Uncharacterized protein n=1 Tax=bioreactor metagenome TaxID=1076179 RepID=A0A645H3V6_9ZZZZ
MQHRANSHADQRARTRTGLLIDQPRGDDIGARCAEVHHRADPKALRRNEQPLQQADHTRQRESPPGSVEKRSNQNRHVRHVVFQKACGRKDWKVNCVDKQNGEPGQHAEFGKAVDVESFCHIITSR